MTATEISLLSAAALLAGAMNAVAGGGTVLTFPALLAFGMPTIQANATSTLALLLGILGSVFGYRRQMPAIVPLVTRFGILSGIGGLLGALLLTRTREATFAAFVPFLLLFATILFLAHNALRRFIRLEPLAQAADLLHRRGILTAYAFQFLVALYGGYFGAGIGILMLASLGILGMHDIHEMNALKTVLGALINLVAAIYFVFAGLIVWPEALVMAAASTVGYFTASHYAQRIPQAAVRKIAAAIGLCISAWLLWKQFG
ncbi:MAG: sulfite exporter TauE/SafE family protein [Terrimicrobiaceae bacterium]|nr:sulfite exporter TauE/SafE family protein [Terrimicrobiaceae bacterium]